MSRQDDIDLELDLLRDESDFLTAKEKFQALSPDERTEEQVEAYTTLKHAFEEKRTLWRSIAAMAAPAEGEIRVETVEGHGLGFQPGGEG